MRTIKVQRVYYDISALYGKANTRTQRALLGYMVKGGYAQDPVYGGAFKLIKAIEANAGLYTLSTDEPPKTAMEIINIAESAMLGMWDEFSFTDREINSIMIKLGNLNRKKV